MSMVLSALLLGWAMAVATVSAVAMGRVLLQRRRAKGEATPTQTGPAAPAVVVVRPCAGAEPHLRRCLKSTASLHYGGPWRMVFSTSTAEDPARPVLHAVGSSLRSRGCSVEIATVPPEGANLKASQLAGLLDSADDDIALVIDSDVDLEGLDLDRLLIPLCDPSTRMAVVWCPPVEREPSRVGDRMSAALLGGSLHSFALLGTLDPHGMVGKTFAVRLDALRAIGGFEPLRQYLGEDMELARRLRSQGWGVTMAPRTVASLASGRRVSQVIARYARWLMVIRAQRPALLASYPLLLVATPGLVVVGSVALAYELPGAAAALVLAVVARVAVGLVARITAQRSLHPGAIALDVILADGLLLVAFARAALGPARVRWRERSLRIGAGGRLERS